MRALRPVLVSWSSADPLRLGLGQPVCVHGMPIAPDPEGGLSTTSSTKLSTGSEVTASRSGAPSRQAQAWSGTENPAMSGIQFQALKRVFRKQQAAVKIDPLGQ